MAGPQSLNNAAQFSPALAGLRDWCAGARLPTSAGTALPVRAYITRVRPAAAERSGPAPQLTPRHAFGAPLALCCAFPRQAPDWTPALERFPEDDTRVVDGGARGGGTARPQRQVL